MLLAEENSKTILTNKVKYASRKSPRGRSAENADGARRRDGLRRTRTIARSNFSEMLIAAHLSLSYRNLPTLVGFRRSRFADHFLSGTVRSRASSCFSANQSADRFDQPETFYAPIPPPADRRSFLRGFRRSTVDSHEMAVAGRLMGDYRRSAALPRQRRPPARSLRASW